MAARSGANAKTPEERAAAARAKSERAMANPAFVEQIGRWKDPVKQKEAADKGRPGSHAAARRNGLFRQAVKELLNSGLSGSEIDKKLNEELIALGVTTRNQAAAITLAMGNKAKEGDVSAAAFLRDTAGEKPVTGVDIGMSDEPIESLDLSAVSEEELRAMVADREAEQE